MKSSRTCRANVHTGAFSYGFKTFENLNFISAVFLLNLCHFDLGFVAEILDNFGLVIQFLFVVIFNFLNQFIYFINFFIHIYLRQCITAP